MSEGKTTATEETVSETIATETNQDSSIEKLKAERAYSQKQRNRAQDAEKRLLEYQAKFKKAEDDKLKEKEEFKTLYEKASSELEVLSANANKWAEYEKSKRNSLLEIHPEEDRERLSNLDLDTLKYVTNKIQNVKPNAPEAIGRSKASIPNKKWADMSDEERRAFYVYKANSSNR